MSYLRAMIDLVNTVGPVVALRESAGAEERSEVETYLREVATPNAIARARALGAPQSIQAAGPRACVMYMECWDRHPKRRPADLAAEVARELRREFGVAVPARGIARLGEAGALDAGALTQMLDGLLESMCNLYGSLAGKRVIGADGQREAVSKVAAMLNDHIGHLADVETKYTGGKQDSKLRQAA
jgi:hypothetical protein